MKKRNLAKKIIYIILTVLIIIGCILFFTKGFNIELLYSNRQEIILSNSTQMDLSKIREISKTVLQNENVMVQRVERFQNAVSVISNKITDEDKENIINKVNEECGTNISNEEIDIISISNTRIRDILKPYILPIIITFVVVLVYFIFMYHKIGWIKIILKSIFMLIITWLTYYSIILIARIPFGRIINSIAIGIYIASIGILTIIFQRQKEELLEIDKKESDK